MNGNMNSDKTVKKGQIWYADLGIGEGSIQGGKRPVYIESNWKCNLYSPVITVIPITSEYNNKAKLPTHVLLTRADGVIHDSIALVEQVRPLNKRDLGELVSECCLKETIGKIDVAYQIQGQIQIIDINKFIDISERINDDVDYLRTEKYDREIYHECNMLIAELKEYCFKSNISFENKYEKLINRFRNLKIEERIIYGIVQ